MNEFQVRLKKAMDIKGISQTELAERLDISKSSINQYLNGYAKPKLNNINSIAKILNVNIDWLLGQSNDMEVVYKGNNSLKNEYIFTDKNKKVLKVRLLETMIKKGFKQETLADKSKVPLEVVNGYIIGNLEPKMKYLEKLAKTLEVLPEFLIGEDRQADMQLLARKLNKLDEEKFKRALELVDSIIDSLEKLNGLGE